MRLWLLRAALALAVALPGVTRADPPTGVYAFEFGMANAVWGGKPFEPDAECPEAVPCVVDPRIDPAGRVSGAVEYFEHFELQEIPVFAHATGPLKGSASGKNGRAKFNLISNLRGSIDSVYKPLPLRGGFQWRLDSDGGLGTYVTWSSFRLCFPGGCARLKTPKQTLDIQADDGGPWQLELELVTGDMNRVTGSAIASFSDGSEPITFDVKGRYNPNPKRDESQLTLSSVLPAKGAKIAFTHFKVALGSLTRYDLSYKVRGQSGRVKFPPLPPPTP